MEDLSSSDRFSSVLRSGCFNDNRSANICEELQRIVTFIYENPCARDFRKPGKKPMHIFQIPGDHLDVYPFLISFEYLT